MGPQSEWGEDCVLNDVQCEFLGHIADGDGIKHTEKRISAVKKMVRPHDKKQVKAFLGLVNYFEVLQKALEDGFC